MYLEKLINELNTKQSFRIVFLGDSITSAEWVHPNWRDIVEYVLKEELSKKLDNWKIPSWGIRCINSGFDGSTTRDWLDRLERDVLNYNPDMVIVMGTINDMDLNIPVLETKNNILKILNRLTLNIPSVIYSTDIATNNGTYNLKYQPYLDAIKSVFPIDKTTFINMYDTFIKLSRDKFFTFESTGNDVVGIRSGDVDFMHPNQLGNAYIARVILDKVFNINFDPEKYIQENNLGKMFPNY